MNVLEKILEEILQYRKDNSVLAGKQVMAIEEIIRSHMDDCKTFEFDFTGVKSFDCQCGRHYVNTCNDDWIPVEKKLPEDDRYILLSFENFSIPLVGRYEENEKGGAFYLGDCDEEDTCISNDLYVNAWTYLPERYKGDSNA